MDIFSDFCNICYKVNDGNLKNISEDNVKHLKDILITFVGHADIVKHYELYLCQLCREELIRFEKFKEMCFNHLIQLRQTYFNMLSELEVEDDSAAVKNTLKRFVHENILRSNCFATSNCSVSVATEHHEIIKSSENLNVYEPVFNKQLINLQSQRSESEFDCDYRDESVINNVTECHETISSEEMKSEKFESEFKEDFDVSDINNANVRDTSKIEFTKEEFDLNNAMMPRCDSVHFTMKILENELDEHANSDLKVPVVHSGTEFTEQELHVKQDNSELGLKLETSEEEIGGGLNVAFEIANEHTIVNTKDRGNEDIRSEKARDVMKLESGECNNKSIPSIMNSQQSRSRVRQQRHGRCPTALKSGVHNRVNPAAEPHTCTVCNASFRTKRSLTIHKDTHSDERPYKCTVCNKAFKQSGNLNAHKRIHSGDKPYKCTVCNKAFISKPYLNAHGRVHSGDKPYQCTVCNKAFAALTTLIVHKRIHSGERPYQCTVCKKSFIKGACLTRHERIHTNDRPYKCTLCNKAFKESGHLTKHERIHSDERPYKCTMCNKAFRQSSGLTRHTRIHTGDKPFECSV